VLKLLRKVENAGSVACGWLQVLGAVLIWQTAIDRTSADMGVARSLAGGGAPRPRFARAAVGLTWGSILPDGHQVYSPDVWSVALSRMKSRTRSNALRT
jgi:hypothetical protein